MKVIELTDRVLFLDDIIQTCKEGYYYYVTTKNGTYDIYESDYNKIKNYLLSLNEEVEIIEDTPKDAIITLKGTPNSIRKSIGLSSKEDKKIEKIKDYSIMETMGLDGKLQERKITKDVTLEEIMNKINEIIDKINGE